MLSRWICIWPIREGGESMSEENRDLEVGLTLGGSWCPLQNWEPQGEEQVPEKEKCYFKNDWFAFIRFVWPGFLGHYVCETKSKQVSGSKIWWSFSLLLMWCKGCHQQRWSLWVSAMCLPSCWMICRRRLTKWHENLVTLRNYLYPHFMDLAIET